MSIAIYGMCLLHTVESIPTPRPAFPFTVLPKPGEGHRKIAGLKRPGKKRTCV